MDLQVGRSEHIPYWIFTGEENCLDEIIKKILLRVQCFRYPETIAANLGRLSIKNIQYLTNVQMAGVPQNIFANLERPFFEKMSLNLARKILTNDQYNTYVDWQRRIAVQVEYAPDEPSVVPSSSSNAQASEPNRWQYKISILEQIQELTDETLPQFEHTALEHMARKENGKDLLCAFKVGQICLFQKHVRMHFFKLLEEQSIFERYLSDKSDLEKKEIEALRLVASVK